MYSPVANTVFAGGEYSIRYLLSGFLFGPLFLAAASASAASLLIDPVDEHRRGYAFCQAWA